MKKAPYSAPADCFVINVCSELAVGQDELFEFLIEVILTGLVLQSWAK